MLGLQNVLSGISEASFLTALNTCIQYSRRSAAVSHTLCHHGMRVTGHFTCISEPRGSRGGSELAPSGLLPLAAGSQLTQQPLASLTTQALLWSLRLAVSGAADMATMLCALGTCHLPWSALREAMLR